MLNFASPSLSLPPQNVDAEESILGSILLDSTAIERIAKTVSEEAFYITSHQVIYRAAHALHSQGHPTDLENVSDWLHDNGLLAQAGGRNKLFELLECTVSSVNIDRYATLVMDKYIRRQLIQAGNEIVDLSYATDIPLETVVKQAERKIKLCVSQDKVDYAVYSQLIKEIEHVVKNIFDPGFKQFKLAELSKQYKIPTRSLEDIYFKYLVNKEYEPFQTLNDLALKYEGRVQEWLAGGLIPTPSTIVFHAPGGMGKTRFLYRLIQKLVLGEDDWDFPISQPCHGLIIQTDESPEQSLRTFQSQGLDNSLNLKIKTKWTIEQIALLRQEIEQMEVKPKFLIIDNLSSVSRNSIFSENDMEYARPILILAEMARDLGLAIVIVHHSNREGSLRGSSAIIASADMEMKLSPCSNDPSGSRRLLTIGPKSRMRRPAEYQLLVDWERNDWTIEQESGIEPNDLKGKTKDKIIQFLREHRGQVFETEEIYNSVGSTLSNVRRCAGELACDGIIGSKQVNVRKKKAYFLPNSSQNLSDHPIAKKKSDRKSDRKQNPDSEGDRPSSDHPIAKNAIFSDSANEKKLKNSDRKISNDKSTAESVTESEMQPTEFTDRFTDRSCDHCESDRKRHIGECDSLRGLAGEENLPEDHQFPRGTTVVYLGREDVKGLLRSTGAIQKHPVTEFDLIECELPNGTKRSFARHTLRAESREDS